MFIRAGFEISVSCPTETALLCALSPRPEIRPVLGDAAVRSRPWAPTQTYIDSFGNRVTRVTNTGGLVTLVSDFVIEDSGQADEVHPWAEQIPVDRLPAEPLRYLVPSRFVESDLLSGDAWAMFGHITDGWARVQAVCYFVHNHIQFGYQYGRPTKTALDAYREARGVCRDFAHLSIAFCRALNIPARYGSGYLGDIGIPYNPDPMDFCAWFEVFLGGRWYTFDARYNTPRIGRILMVRGMDAADVSIVTSYGPHSMEKFEVWCEEIPEGFPLDALRNQLRVPVVGVAAASRRAARRRPALRGGAVPSRTARRSLRARRARGPTELTDRGPARHGLFRFAALRFKSDSRIATICDRIKKGGPVSRTALCLSPLGESGDESRPLPLFIDRGRVDHRIPPRDHEKAAAGVEGRRLIIGLGAARLPNHVHDFGSGLGKLVEPAGQFLGVVRADIDRMSVHLFLLLSHKERAAWRRVAGILRTGRDPRREAKAMQGQIRPANDPDIA